MRPTEKPHTAALRVQCEYIIEIYKASTPPPIALTHRARVKEPLALLFVYNINHAYDCIMSIPFIQTIPSVGEEGKIVHIRYFPEQINKYNLAKHADKILAVSLILEVNNNYYY